MRPTIEKRSPAIKQSADLVRRIASWVQATQSIAVPTGPSQADSRQKAAALRAALPHAYQPTFVSELERDVNLPDTLHALVELLESPVGRLPGHFLHEVSATWDLVSSVSWEDDFCERDDLLARIAFLGWDHCREYRTYQDTEEWRRRCVERCLAQPHVRQFLALDPEERSPSLMRRFLSDRRVFLAACDRLDRERNRSPKLVDRDARSLYEWLASCPAPLGRESQLKNYFLAYSALRVTTALQFLGGDSQWREWFQRTSIHVELAGGSETLRQLVRFARLSYLHVKREHSLVLESIGDVIKRFQELGMVDKELSARFLQSTSLKEIGRLDEALITLVDLRAKAVRAMSDLVLGLALSESAQIYSARGDSSRAEELAFEALPVLLRSGCPWAFANAQATLGEVLRNRADFDRSIRGYRAGVSILEKAGMDATAAYVGVLLAEDLLLAGRHDESVAQIVKVLPTIERENLNSEAFAAVAILREAVRRQKADPIALRDLRASLVRMREGGL